MATNDPYRIADPYTVGDMHDMVGDLVLGRFFVVRHEQLGDFREEWKTQLSEMCERAGVLIDYVDIPREDMTLGFNHWTPPTFEQSRTLIAAAVYARMMGREFGTKFQVNP